MSIEWYVNSSDEEIKDSLNEMEDLIEQFNVESQKMKNKEMNNMKNKEVFYEIYNIPPNDLRKLKILTSGLNEFYASKTVEQIIMYSYIYIKLKLDRHWKVNRFISENNDWDRFPDIRSLNDHGDSLKVPGIRPVYYKIVCKLGMKTDEKGENLDDFHVY